MNFLEMPDPEKRSPLNNIHPGSLSSLMVSLYFILVGFFAVLSALASEDAVRAGAVVQGLSGAFDGRLEAYAPPPLITRGTVWEEQALSGPLSALRDESGVNILSGVEGGLFLVLSGDALFADGVALTEEGNARLVRIAEHIAASAPQDVTIAWGAPAARSGVGSMRLKAIRDVMKVALPGAAFGFGRPGSGLVIAVPFAGGGR